MNCKSKEKYIGVLLIAAIGDALGWPNEQNNKIIKKIDVNLKSFVPWRRKCGGK